MCHTGAVTGITKFDVANATQLGDYFTLNISVTNAESLTVRLTSSGQTIGSPVAVRVVSAAVSPVQSSVNYTYPDPLVAGINVMVTMKLLDAFNNSVLPSADDNTSLELKGKHADINQPLWQLLHTLLLTVLPVLM